MKILSAEWDVADVNPFKMFKKKKELVKSSPCPLEKHCTHVKNTIFTRNKSVPRDLHHIWVS